MQARLSTHLRLRPVLVGLLLCLSASLIVPAQSIVGRIAGTVSDSTGAAIPGVVVKITHEANG